MPFGIGDAVKGVDGILGKIIPDKTERMKASMKLREVALTGDIDNNLAQIAINAQDAKSDHFIQYAWRPSVGWACVASLIYNFILYPTINWVAYMIGADISSLPDLKTDALNTLLFALLGFGGFRTYEKINKDVMTKKELKRLKKEVEDDE